MILVFCDLLVYADGYDVVCLLNHVRILLMYFWGKLYAFSGEWMAIVWRPALRVGVRGWRSTIKRRGYFMLRWDLIVLLFGGSSGQIFNMDLFFVWEWEGFYIGKLCVRGLNVEIFVKGIIFGLKKFFNVKRWFFIKW